MRGCNEITASVIQKIGTARSKRSAHEVWLKLESVIATYRAQSFFHP